MSTQTVYFNNPASITALQTTTATQTTQITSMSGSIANLEQLSQGFPWESVPMNVSDRVTVPENFTATPVLKAYDRMVSSIPECTNMGRETFDSFWYRHGEGCDGIYYIPLTGSSSEGLLCSNHENNAMPLFLFTGGFTVNNLTGPTGASCFPFVSRPWEDVYKHALTLGVSITHIRKDPATNVWSIVLDSTYNKRYNLFSEFRIDGPLRGHDLMKTKHSPDGTTCLGTFSNCASEVMPWGTFLTAEENCYFAFGCTRSQNAFGGKSETEQAAINRYGFNYNSNRFGAFFGSPNTNTESTRFVGYSGPLGSTNGHSSPFLLDVASTGYLSSPLYGGPLMPTGSFEHLDYTCYGTTGADDFRNIINQYNHMKEIDPKNPSSVPRVRTALGRMGHENSATIVQAGQPVVVYLNDDNRSDYLYKYVSDALWNEADRNGGLAAGDKYLNTGTLYIAKFNNATLGSTDTYGTGSWISFKSLSYPINITYGGYPGGGNFDVVINNYEEALVYARMIGDSIGATKMDRGEWSTVDKRNNIVYTAFTSNRFTAFTAVSPTASSLSTSRGAPVLSSVSPRIYRDFSSDAAFDSDGTTTSSDNSGNQNGGIIRYKCYSGASENAAGTTFRWDHFLFGCTPGTIGNKNINISNLDMSNVFSMPDTCVFGEYSGQEGYLWHGCDDTYMTNSCNAAVYATYIPSDSYIGDGKALTITSQLRDSDGYFSASGAVTTYVAKDRPTSRFMVGVPGCEVTAWSETPDGTTAFVGIQHPGYNYYKPQLNTTLPQVSQGMSLKAMFQGSGINSAYAVPDSSYPDTSFNRPRSTILAIQRKDGKPIV